MDACRIEASGASAVMAIPPVSACTEQVPAEIDSIADLQKLAVTLAARGYSDTDIDAIFHGKWLRFFLEALPPD